MKLIFTIYLLLQRMAMLCYLWPAKKNQIFKGLACFTTQVQLLLQTTFYRTNLTQPKVWYNFVSFQPRNRLESPPVVFVWVWVARSPRDGLQQKQPQGLDPAPGSRHAEVSGWFYTLQNTKQSLRARQHFIFIERQQMDLKMTSVGWQGCQTLPRTVFWDRPMKTTCYLSFSDLFILLG
jgi:hypothetical protein